MIHRANGSTRDQTLRCGAEAAVSGNALNTRRRKHSATRDVAEQATA